MESLEELVGSEHSLLRALCYDFDPLEKRVNSLNAIEIFANPLNVTKWY